MIKFKDIILNEYENSTKSQIILEFNHIDHANRLYEVLKTFNLFGKGGDCSINGEDIGHDVNCKISHKIFDE